MEIKINNLPGFAIMRPEHSIPMELVEVKVPVTLKIEKIIADWWFPLLAPPAWFAFIVWIYQYL
ncbi:TPA: hypothetical protein ACJIWE_000684 [Enterobacter roggenkampii]